MNRQMVFTGAKLVAVIVVFALLMAMRDAFSAGWERVLLAAIAFAILGVVVARLRDRSM